MQKSRIYSSWQWLLLIFTFVSQVEAVFYSQMLAFTPLYLPELGVSDDRQILLLVGWITAASNGLGIPFLPFWVGRSGRPLFAQAYHHPLVRRAADGSHPGLLCALCVGFLYRPQPDRVRPGQ